MNPEEDDQQAEQADDDQQAEQAEQDEQADDDQQAEQDDDGDESGEDDERDTFPRPYVQRLRARSAGYRARAKESEERVTELERSLFTERVRALDVLADPDDLPFNADLLDDPDALRAEVDALVAKSPHYRRRGTTTGTGAHEQGKPPAEGVSLLGLMRGGA